MKSLLLLFCLISGFQLYAGTLNSSQDPSGIVHQAPKEYRNGKLYSNLITVKFSNAQVIATTIPDEELAGTESVSQNYSAIKNLLNTFTTDEGGNPAAIIFKRSAIDQALPTLQNIFTIHFPVMVNVEDLTVQLKGATGVELVQKPYTIQIQGVPFTDAGVVFSHPQPNWHLNQIQAPEAWVFMQNGLPQTVAIIDEGRVSNTHPELAGKIANENAHYGACGPIIVTGAHATEVASLIASVPNSNHFYLQNGIGRWGGTISVGNDKINVGSHYYGNPTSQCGYVLAAISEFMTGGVNYATPRVLNCSFTYYDSYTNNFLRRDEIPLEIAAFEALISQGILIFASAGNQMGTNLERRGIGYPFGLPGIIGVGATGKNTDLFGANTSLSGFAEELGLSSGNSTTGTSSGLNYNYNHNKPGNPNDQYDPGNFDNDGYLDITAPGQRIGLATTNAAGNSSVANVSGEGFMAGVGTSLSSPIVATVAASMLSANPNLSNQDITNILLQTADKVRYNPNGLTLNQLNGTTNYSAGYRYNNGGAFSDPTLDFVMGKGRVNMLSAVMNAAGKSPGGFTINSTLPYSAVKVNDINKQAYLYTLPAGTFNAQYEYDAVLNQPGSHIRFAGVGSKFELEPNSTFRVSDGAQMTFENGGELILQPPTGNQFTKYVVDAGGNLTLQNSASTLQTVTIPSGTVLLVNSTGSLTLNNVRLVLEAGASLALRGGANLSVTGVNGAIIVNNGANFCVEPGAYLSLAQNVNTIQLAGGAINGINTGITGTNTNCQPFCAITYSGNGSIQTSSGCFFFSAGSVINNIACIGTSGSVNVALSGLDPAFPVTYSWSPNPAAGQGTPVISVTTAGNYTVTVTHQNIAKSHVFTVANEPGFSLNAFHFNSSGVSNGAVQIVGGPANAVYSYSWNTNPVQTTAMAQLTPGSHQVTVTNSSGCSATASIVIPAALPFGVGITYNSDPCSIPGPTQATATPLLGQPPYAYSWSPAPAMGQGTENVTFSSSGNYTVTVTDNNSATASATIMVTLPVITAPSSVISTNTTWTGPILIEGEIRINPGVVLTLDNAQVQVRYAQLQDPNLGNTIYERAGIVVAAGSSPKPGGQLIITNNSTVQGCANNWWDGIDVLGNPDAAQSEIFQGLVVISGNSTIKNAWCGIKALVTPRPFVRYYKGLSGGIIKATNANFENNARGVFLGHYIQQSASFFSGCAFTRDVLCPFNNIVYGSQPFKWTGAHLIEIDGVRFAGNTFQNYFVVDGIFSVPQSWGTGILSQGAGYKLQGLSGTGNGNNHFINLTYGIDAGLYSGVARKVIAEGNNFTQTLNGIYIQGGLLDQLLRNEFVLPTVMNAAYPGKGITMVNSSGFLIEGNTVGVTEMNHSYGILFESSGTTGGTVFNNTITGALIGIQVQKNNPNLKLRCNTLDNIDVSGHGLAVVNNPAGTTSTLKQQGSDCNTTGGNINQAGNEWLNVSCSSSSPDNRQIFVDNNVTFDYWAHELNQQGQPTTVPLCSSPTWKASYMYKCDFVNKTANSCASYIPGIITPNPLTDPQAYLTDIAEVKNEYATYLAEAELAIAELKGDLDGGDTQGLLEFLQEGGHTAENVRDHLIDALPLSDTVLLMVINLPARLPDSYLDKVVAPNAPFSYRVLDALYELTPIIAPNIMAGIEHAHQNIRQYPQLAELLKAYNWWHGEMRLLDNERHRVLQQQGDLQASMALLHTSDELEELRALAETYLAKNQTDSVKAILGRIAQDTVASRIDENVQYMLFMQVMVDLVDSARFIGDMDSLQLAVMQQIASSGYEISDKAEVVLRVALQQNTHHQPYLIPEQQPARTKESARDRYWKQAEALQVKQNHLELYPNPASGQVRARYQLSEGAGIIVMQSLLGQEVARIVIGSQSTETLIETHGLAAGVYLIRLETAGRVQQVQKLVVVKE